MQFRFGAQQNLSVERAVGLLAVFGAKLQIAVNAFAESARQLGGRPTLEMNDVPKACHRAGKCLLFRIEVDGAGGITPVFHHGFLKSIPPGLKPLLIMRPYAGVETPASLRVEFIRSLWGCALTHRAALNVFSQPGEEQPQVLRLRWSQKARPTPLRMTEH